MGTSYQQYLDWPVLHGHHANLMHYYSGLGFAKSQTGELLRLVDFDSLSDDARDALNAWRPSSSSPDAECPINDKNFQKNLERAW
ncbi:hypothetical protein MRB53_039788 [Persea americana]|nr:hypothetical protein MRB53_039788 [Persea americana]